MDFRLRAVENDALAIERFYKPKQKQSFQNSFDFINPLTCFEFDGNPSIGSTVLMKMGSQANFGYIMSPMTFEIDLVAPKYNQFIGSARNIHDPCLAGIHQSVLQITWSWERDVCTCIRTEDQSENIMPQTTLLRRHKNPRSNWERLLIWHYEMGSRM